MHGVCFLPLHHSRGHHIPETSHCGTPHCILAALSTPENQTSHYPRAICRGVMPIETKGARAPSDFWAKWIFNAASKRQKIAESYFYIWYNHTGVIRSFSALNHQLLNSNRCSLAGAQPETDVFLQRCIITNHTRFCWPYECNDQSEAFRWVTAETRFVQGACSLTEFSHQKQQCVRCK